MIEFEKLNVDETKKQLRKYNEESYSLFLNQFNIRDENYKNSMFKYIIMTLKKIPKNKQYNIIEKIIDGGVNLNSPIHMCKHGGSVYSVLYFILDNIELIKLLLDRGVDPDCRPYHNSPTPLYYACRYGFRDTVELLIHRGANINIHNNSCIHIAKHYKRENIIKLLTK